MPDDGEGIRLALEREDIKSRPLWKPMHLQPVFRGYEAILPRPLPAREGRSVAEALFRDGLCLPSGAAMSEADLARVVEVVRSLHSTHSPT
ncbi:MAG: DegT/DnrJ/EryC1/StrS family aminotransferase [Anaerolineae bacterium]